MGDRLRGRVAAVTGAGSGIGRACALRFAGEGAKVVVNDVDPERASATVKAIEAAGGAATACRGDVSDPQAVDAIIEAARSAYGTLDVFVNNAALPLGGTIADTSPDGWRSVFEVTLHGTFYGVRAAVRQMAAQGGGSVINISSGAGLGGEAGLGAYAAAKAAVVNLTQTAAVENAERGVRINAICPGPIETPPLAAFVEGFPGGRDAFVRQIPAKRIGRPEEIAAVALFLASDEASYVNGATLVADGGISARNASPRPD